MRWFSFLLGFIFLSSLVSAATIDLSPQAVLQGNTYRCAGYCEAYVVVNNPRASDINITTAVKKRVTYLNGSVVPFPLRMEVSSNDVQNCTITVVNGSDSVSCTVSNVGLILHPGDNTIHIWTTEKKSGESVDWNFNFTFVAGGNTYIFDTVENGWAPWAAGTALDTNLVAYFNMTDFTGEKPAYNLTRILPSSNFTNVTGITNNGTRLYSSRGNNTGTLVYNNTNFGIIGTSAQAISVAIRLSTNFSSQQVTEQYVFTKQDGTDKVRYGIMVENITGTTKVRFERTKPGVGSQMCDYTPGTALNSTDYALVTITWKTDTLWGYFDNISACNVAASGTSSFGADCFTVGSSQNTACTDSNANSSLFSGDVDEIGVWSRNLTVEDVNSLWQNYTFHTFRMNITSPQTATPLSVTDGVKATINFTAQDCVASVCTNVLTNLNVTNVSIGGISCTIGLAPNTCTGTPSACSTFSSSSACTTAGCSWNNANGTGVAFPSKNSVLNGNGWATPNNGQADDNAFTTSAGAGTLNATNYTSFGFTIPAGVTINGITVRVARKAGGASGVNVINISVWNGSAWSVGNATVDIGTTNTNQTLGGNTYLWGLTWDYTAANNISINVSTPTTNTQTMSLDAIAVNISYSPCGGTPSVCSGYNASSSACTTQGCSTFTTPQDLSCSATGCIVNVTTPTGLNGLQDLLVSVNYTSVPFNATDTEAQSISYPSIAIARAIAYFNNNQRVYFNNNQRIFIN